MADSGVPTFFSWLPDRGDILSMSITQDTKGSADRKSAHHGQNQAEEKAPTSHLNIFFLSEKSFLD